MKSEFYPYANHLETYRFTTYFRDEWPTWIILILFLLSQTIMLMAVGLSASIILGISLMSAGYLSLAVVLRFMRRQKFYRELVRMAHEEDDTWLYPQLIACPAFYEGALVYECLCQISWSLSLRIDKEREAARNYRSFIELWVHEVKAPLAASLLALERQPSTSESNAIRLQLERIEQQVNRALYYARSTSLENDLIIRRISLKDVCSSACRSNARFLIEKGCTPQIDIDETCSVFCDEKWLQFILAQIIINAAQYGATTIRFCAREQASTSFQVPLQSITQNKLPDCLSSEDSAQPQQTNWVLEIADNGRGIPAADVPRVFDQGFTGENGRLFHSSTGIGLYLVALMCQQLNVGVQIGSEQGKGTRLFFTFSHDPRRFDDCCNT